MLLPYITRFQSVFILAIFTTVLSVIVFSDRTTAQILFNQHESEPEEIKGKRFSTSPNSHPVYDFATNLYRTVAVLKPPNENILISPFSIRVITSLLYLAAKGQTSHEIRTALQLPSNHNELIENLSKQMRATTTSATTEYKIGNGIFIKHSAHLNTNFSRIVQERLKSDLIRNDFSNPLIASNRINNWISDLTKNRISKLVSPESISPETSLFLANALFFSGQWLKPFDLLATKSMFHIDNRRKVQVNMMQVESTFGYGYIDKLKSVGISIPFKDDRFEFIVLIPQEKITLSDVELLLADYSLQNLGREIGQNLRNVVVKMPKFKLDVNYDLVGILKRLGIRTIFNPQQSDLSGLVESTRRSNPSRENYVVNQMVHKTVLDINEKGATAAAGTGVGVYPISSPSFLNVDKPFLFLLNDRLTGPVFIGRMVDPSVAGKQNVFSLSINLG